jgi:sec-independent protein translocase protein TatA
MPHLGGAELAIILVIVLLLFGVGRIGKIAGELGSGIRSFRDGLKGPEDKQDVRVEKVEEPVETKVETKVE